MHKAIISRYSTIALPPVLERLLVPPLFHLPAHTVVIRWGAKRDPIAPLEIRVIRGGYVLQANLGSLQLPGAGGDKLGHLLRIAGVGMIEHEDLGHLRDLSLQSPSGRVNTDPPGGIR